MQKPEQSRNVRFHIWLPLHIVNILSRTAKRRNVSLSEQIRRALSIHTDEFRTKENYHDDAERSIRTHRPSS